MKGLVLCLVALAAVASAKSTSPDCEAKCAACPTIERSECLAGMQKDVECGCCDVCSRFEGQKCDMPKDSFKHGECGDGLECKSTSGGAICQCMWEEMVCGTDDKTYNNLCNLMATAVREGLQETLEVKHAGPCNKGAKIATKPQYLKNYTNDNVVLTCEAIGDPVPEIRWSVTRANGKTLEVPGDDMNVVVATRGGPTRYQVTSWVQIEGLLKRHEGDYTCIAQNIHNKDESKARIKVMTKEGEEL